MTDLQKKPQTGAAQARVDKTEVAGDHARRWYRPRLDARRRESLVDAFFAWWLIVVILVLLFLI